jgi:predicted nucleotidyltransferase
MKPTSGSTPAPAAHASLAEAVVLLSGAVPGLLAIYRFGSYGTDQERIDSDIDLAILATQPVETMQRWELAQQLASLFGRDVDLVDLGVSSAVLRAQVVSHGERLYCVDPARCEVFEDFTYTDYARLNEERREILADIHERGSVYGR